MAMLPMDVTQREHDVQGKVMIPALSDANPLLNKERVPEAGEVYYSCGINFRATPLMQ